MKLLKTIYCLILFFFIVTGIFLAGTAAAQTGEEPKTQVETMTIFGTFTPTIKLTPKIENNPGANDYSLKAPALDFEMKTEAIHSVEHSDLLSPDPLPKEEAVKYPHNYLILGFGNYITPYGEFYANASAMNNHAFGIHLKHLSSQGGIKDYANNAFSHNFGDLYYKFSGKRFTLKADVYLKRDVVHYYGFQPTETFNPGKDTIRQRYFLGGTTISFGSNDVVPTDFSYLIALKYYNFSDRFKNSENAFNINADFNKGFYLFNSRVPQKAGAKVDFAVYNNKNVLQHLGMPDTTTFTNTDVQLGIQPYFICDWSEYRLKIGADLGLLRNSEGTDFYIHPTLEATIKIIQNRLYLFARVGGAIERNSFSSLTEENLFIAPGHYTANFMNKKITAAAGFSAMITQGFDLKIGGEYARIDNMPFFTSLPDDPAHSFHTLYDKVHQTDLFVESAYALSNKLSFGLALHYYICQPDSLTRAYYKPDFKMMLQGMYRPIERLKIDASFNLYSRMWADDPYTHQEVHLPFLYNLNLSAEYRVWRELYLFAQANNIFAQNYERYLNYPTQGFNIMGGIRFRF